MFHNTIQHTFWVGGDLMRLIYLSVTPLTAFKKKTFFVSTRSNKKKWNHRDNPLENLYNKYGRLVCVCEKEKNCCVWSISLYLPSFSTYGDHSCGATGWGPDWTPFHDDNDKRRHTHVIFLFNKIKTHHVSAKRVKVCPKFGT